VPVRTPYMRPYYYYNAKHRHHGVLYQVGCSVNYPIRLVDFSGPFKGSSSDVGIFRQTLLPQLRNREMVMCDKGYIAEPRCWTPPRGKFYNLSRAQKGQSIEVTRIRQVNERVIGRLKEWGVMRKTWRLSFDLHRLCARCAAKLTQLQLYTNPVM
jgi:hypothetical protein